jgi:hypothetical protein
MRHECLGSEVVRFAFFLIGLLCGLPERPVSAQSSDPEDTGRKNYAFASQLGSGIYQLSGHTVQIYRVPVYYPIRPAQGRYPGVRVTLSGCIGYFELSPTDADPPDNPDDVAMASFVPGVALEFPVLKNWSLEPFGELGVAQDFHDSERATVYTVGLKSLAKFRPRGVDLLLGHRLVYAGDHVSDSEYDEDFVMLETGFEVRRPLAFEVKGHGLDGGLYIMNYLYLEPTRVFLRDEPLEVGNQYELGFTVGTRVPVEFWRFSFPRLGLGYRFGDDASAVRLVLGAAF